MRSNGMRFCAIVSLLLLLASCVSAGPTPVPPAGPTQAELTAVAAMPSVGAATAIVSPSPVTAAATETPPPPVTPGASVPANVSPSPSAAAFPTVRTSQDVSLRSEIFLAGAPTFAIVFICEPPAGLAGPAVTWQQGEGLGQLCLYGFPEGEEVRYEVYDSERGLVETGVTVPDTLDGPQPAGRVVLNVEVFPSGEWLVQAEAGGTRLEENFRVAPPDGPGKVAVRLDPGREAANSGRKLDGLNAGDEVFVRAANLPGDAEIPITVYAAAVEDFVRTPMKLHEQAVMLTDEAGTLSAQITLDPSYAPGFFCVVIAVAQDYEPVRGSGEGGAAECFNVVP